MKDSGKKSALNPESRILTPAIILVRPQLGENIGAVARAMGNFGFSELRLVAPRDGWPNKRALEVASDGKTIIEAAKVFPDLAAAMHDIHAAYATTARRRDMAKRVVTPQGAMRELSALTRLVDARHPLPQAGEGIKAALVFGAERTGLENGEIVMCDAIVTIPTAAKNSSLNLGQSAVVLMYEWFTGHPERAEGESKELKAIDPSAASLRDSAQDDKIATKKDWQALFVQLDRYLEAAKYYRTAHKKPVMRQNMHNMLLRGGWSEQEVRSFRGMLRVLAEGRKKGAKG